MIASYLGKALYTNYNSKNCLSQNRLYANENGENQSTITKNQLQILEQLQIPDCLLAKLKYTFYPPGQTHEKLVFFRKADNQHFSES